MKKLIREERSVGKLILLIGILLAVPLLVLPFYPSERHYAVSFLIPSVFSILLGIGIGLFPKKAPQKADFREHLYSSSLTVLCAWGYGILAGAVPFVIAKRLTPVQALFEAVSGWTTTGLSVMDVAQESNIFLFHRSFMQFCGGLGFVMMMIVFVQEKESMNLYSAEGHPDRIMPSLKKTARIILLMYLGFLFAGILLLSGAGMPLFDSINHAMCALSTGGFSTRTESVGAYHSIPVETVTNLLMLIGATNFAVLVLLVQRKFKKVLAVSEVRFMLFLLALAVPVVSLNLFSRYLEKTFLSGIRTALFNVIAALSTTGFSTVSFGEWPSFSLGIMILLMLIGGGIGSTAGGLKLARVYIMLRLSSESIKERISSRRRISAPFYHNAQGKQPLDTALYKQTASFATVYLLLFLLGSLLLTETADCSLTEAMFEFSSALGTVGLSVGITNPSANRATLLVEMAGMLLGRLEIYIVLIGFYSAFNRMRSLYRHFSHSSAIR